MQTGARAFGPAPGQCGEQERQALCAGEFRGVLHTKPRSHKVAVGISGGSPTAVPPIPAVVLCAFVPLCAGALPSRFPPSPRLGVNASIRQTAKVPLVEAERFQVAGVQAPEEDRKGLGFQAVKGFLERGGGRGRRTGPTGRTLRMGPQTRERGIVGAVVEGVGGGPGAALAVFKRATHFRPPFRSEPQELASEPASLSLSPSTICAEKRSCTYYA